MGQQRRLGHVKPVFFQQIHLGKDFPRRTVHDNPPAVHHIDIVRENHFFHIMGDQDHRNAFLLVQLSHCLQHLFASIGIQHGSGLIQHNAPGVHGHNARDGHPLFLAAGQLIGRLTPVGGHPHRLQALIHPFPDILCGNPQIFRSEPHIFFHHISDNLIIRILKYHSCFLPDSPHIRFGGGIHLIHPQGSLRGHQQRVDLFGQRGLSAAVMSQHRNKLAFLHIEVHLVNGPVHLRFLTLLAIFQVIIHQFCRFYYSHKTTWSFCLFSSIAPLPCRAVLRKRPETIHRKLLYMHILLRCQSRKRSRADIPENSKISALL